jgi:hypothetical protein
VVRKELVRLVDDVDGGDASETVGYALDGIAYEIDLSEKNAARLREALAEFIPVSRRTGRVPGATWRPGVVNRPPSAASVGRPDNGAIRAWAKQNWTGTPISDRGRIPQDVLDAYRKAASRD